MNAPTEMPTPLVFTESAANKVKQLIDEEGNPELKLRVFVSGDVHYSSLEMHLGAVVDGRLVHEGAVAEKQKKPVELKLATTS